MRKLSLCLTLLLLGASSAVSAGDIVLRTAVTPERAWVGQRVLLHIDVLGDAGWSQITRFGEIELPGAYVMRTDSQGTRLQETIDGTSYTGQRYEVSIFTQVAGALEVPAIPVEVTTREWGPDAAAGVQQAKTPPVTLHSRFPPGAADIRGLVSTNRLTAQQQWAPSIETPKVGDALTRTVILEATDVSGMAFAPLQHAAIEGAGIYPAEPAVKDSADRGSLTGVRTEAVTYVLEQAGEIRIPDIVFSWWNVTDNRLERVTLPGRVLDVAAGPAGASAAAGPAAVKALDVRDRWPVVMVLLAVIAVLWRSRKRLAQRWAARRRRRRESEARYFRAAVKSIRSKRGAAALRDLMRWLDRINTAERPAQLQDFLRRYGDTDAQAAVENLLSCVATDDRLADPVALVEGLSTARDRWRTATQPGRNAPYELPELNGV